MIPTTVNRLRCCDPVLEVPPHQQPDSKFCCDRYRLLGFQSWAEVIDKSVQGTRMLRVGCNPEFTADLICIERIGPIEYVLNEAND
ncbi:hypothetical protein [Novipirellula artificiosorum]|uniref:Uncharacterized protein n=1 Tax=Novipirellula artificiosorum TaxID=2528016 RepID=A0A5C6D7Z0_9BACT|nr:hypothetical protein [Novipirellula artificiosorum]TWU31009.1 hypothetical protein Poly41_64780 [Novipirellula artificiosorum]